MSLDMHQVNKNQAIEGNNMGGETTIAELKERVKVLEKQKQRTLLDDIFLIMIALPFGSLLIWIFGALAYYSTKLLAETKLLLQDNEYASSLMAFIGTIIPNISNDNQDSIMAQMYFFDLMNFREYCIIGMTLMVLMFLFSVGLLSVKYILKFTYLKIKETKTQTKQ